MNDVAQQRFLSPTRGILLFHDVVADILRELGAHKGDQLKVSVGTDSEEFGAMAKYVAVIHVWRIGKGAHAFRTEATEPLELRARHGSERFRERVWREIMLTATLAQELRSALREAIGSGFLDSIEVHADVGAGGGSSSMIREVIGVLKGYGFPDELIKLKPEAYAASAVADHYI